MTQTVSNRHDGYPRVLAIGLESSSTRAGGLNRYFAELLTALSAMGIPISGLVMGDSTSEDGIPPELVVSHGRSLVARLWALGSAAKRHADAEVVDGHFALTIFAMLVRRQLRGRPLVIHFQGPWAEESRLTGDGYIVRFVKHRIEAFIYRRADVFVVLSKSFRRILVELYGVNPWKVEDPRGRS